MKTNTLFLSIVLMLSLVWVQDVVAQKSVSNDPEGLSIEVDKVKAWDTEVSLDTVDQENLPKKVTGGVLFAANMSNFIIRDQYGISSRMNFGVDFGGFMDFSVTKHFAIQPRLIITAEENYVEGLKRTEQKWSVGMDIPVFFMGRYGNMKSGYFQFGAGPFTHFNFASNLNAYSRDPEKVLPITTDTTFDAYFKLHDNHFGLAATIGYEFGMGLQIMFNYQISFSDIFSYYSKNPDIKVSNTSIYPQKMSLGITYRWKEKKRKK